VYGERSEHWSEATMSDRRRVAVALLVVLGVVATWRTSVRTGDLNHGRARRGIGADLGRLGGSAYADATRHTEMRIAETRRRLAERPHDSRLLLRLANLCYRRAYSHALESYSTDPVSARQLEDGDDRQYRDWMRKALQHDPGGDLREAVRAARLGLAWARDPARRWELLRSLARAECARGAHDRELNALKEGQALRPDDPDVLGRLARAYGEVGDVLAVEETLEQAWRAALSRGAPAAVAAGPSRSMGPADARWASSALDGDEWLAELYLHPP
jgi:tetratricopeptide (TPR) repeat protein